MDLETENRLATLLMEEARRLRAQADKEGVNVYLRQPNVRGRPNSRFLTATVLGVEQSNRAVEVSELWRAREKELELNTKLKSGEKHKKRCCGDKRHHDDSYSKSSSGHGQEKASRSSTSSFSNHGCDEDYSDDGGLRDDEVEEFLQSRAKRGRGATGSRMDEPGPYPLSTTSDTEHLVNPDMRFKEEWENRILGPRRPPPPMLAGTRKSHEPPHDEGGGGVDGSKKKHHSRGKQSERSKGKEKKKKSKHHSHKSRRRRGSDSE